MTPCCKHFTDGNSKHLGFNKVWPNWSDNVSMHLKFLRGYKSIRVLLGPTVLVGEERRKDYLHQCQSPFYGELGIWPAWLHARPRANVDTHFDANCLSLCTRALIILYGMFLFNVHEPFSQTWAKCFKGQKLILSKVIGKPNGHSSPRNSQNWVRSSPCRKTAQM